MSCWSEWMDQSESLASERRPLVSAHLCGSWAHEVYGMPSGHVGVSLCWECQQQSSSSGYSLYFSAFKDENKWTLRLVRSTFVPRYIYKYISTAAEKKKMQSILCVLIDSRPVKSSQLKGSFYSDPRSLFRCRHSWFVNDFLLLCFFLRLSETRNTHIVTLDYFGGSWWRSWHTHTHHTHHSDMGSRGFFPLQNQRSGIHTHFPPWPVSCEEAEFKHVSSRLQRWSDLLQSDLQDIRVPVGSTACAWKPTCICILSIYLHFYFCHFHFFFMFFFFP